MGKEGINMKEFKPVGIKGAFKKFRYPFLGKKNIVNNIEFQPKYTFIKEDDVEYQAEVASKKMTLYFLHGFFIFMWYSVVFSCYCWYFAGYCIYWVVAALVDFIKGLIRK